MKNLRKIILILFSVLILNTLFSFTPIKKVSEKQWHGIASFYHHKFSGRKTSSGEIFNNQKYTAANNFLPLGSLVKITNIANGKSVIVKINDRMNKN
ncbi:MAG: septal ring lytic transglycosylase RlpA family protein, partial [Chitinophagaceae bacterium]|nr:septal ring lytic transglycosylase RlpA family protein [Chitinophagaceae bacterium]